MQKRSALANVGTALCPLHHTSSFTPQGVTNKYTQVQEPPMSVKGLDLYKLAPLQLLDLWCGKNTFTCRTAAIITFYEVVWNSLICPVARVGKSAALGTRRWQRGCRVDGSASDGARLPRGHLSGPKRRQRCARHRRTARRTANRLRHTGPAWSRMRIRHTIGLHAPCSQHPIRLRT